MEIENTPLRSPLSAIHVIKFIFLIAVFSIATASCTPYVISYQHVNLTEEGGIEIIERSTTPSDTAGDPLLFSKAQLPVRAILRRPTYVVWIHTPQNPIAVVFLNARSPQGEVLEIEGANIRRTHPNAVGYTHSFAVREANGKPLEFQIRDASGTMLGAESLRYKLETRGITYGIEFM